MKLPVKYPGIKKLDIGLNTINYLLVQHTSKQPNKFIIIILLHVCYN